MKSYGGVKVTSALDGGEVSVSRPCRFTPGERAHNTHWIRGCVSLKPTKKLNRTHTLYTHPSLRSRDSSVGKATCCELEGWCSNPGRVKIFLFSTASSVHSSSYLMGRGAISLEVKRPRHEDNHLPPSNAEVKNGGAILPLPHTPLWYDA
jgi:hypothetical protein